MNAFSSSFQNWYRCYPEECEKVFVLEELGLVETLYQGEAIVKRRSNRGRNETERRRGEALNISGQQPWQENNYKTLHR